MVILDPAWQIDTKVKTGCSPVASPFFFKKKSHDPVMHVVIYFLCGHEAS